VFRVNGLQEVQIWELGDTHVAAEIKRDIVARAELSVFQITSVGLHVDPDEPPPRHANVAGWPPDKGQMMELALELAAFADLRVRSSV